MKKYLFLFLIIIFGSFLFGESVNAGAGCDAACRGWANLYSSNLNVYKSCESSGTRPASVCGGGECGYGKLQYFYVVPDGTKGEDCGWPKTNCRCYVCLCDNECCASGQICQLNAGAVDDYDKSCKVKTCSDYGESCQSMACCSGMVCHKGNICDDQCNLDGICDSSYGETTANCPSDCPATNPNDPCKSTLSCGSGRSIPCDSYGDLDSDGLVSDCDADMLSKYIVGSCKLNTGQKSRADVNDDGTINILDYTDIKTYVLNGGNFHACVTTCNNGSLDPGEECDGTKFPAGLSCASLGRGTGNLGCNSDCTLNYDGCQMTTACANCCGSGYSCYGSIISGTTCNGTCCTVACQPTLPTCNYHCCASGYSCPPTGTVISGTTCNGTCCTTACILGTCTDTCCISGNTCNGELGAGNCGNGRVCCKGTCQPPGTTCANTCCESGQTCSGGTGTGTCGNGGVCCAGTCQSGTTACSSPYACCASGQTCSGTAVSGTTCSGTCCNGTCEAGACTYTCCGSDTVCSGTIVSGTTCGTTCCNGICQTTISPVDVPIDNPLNATSLEKIVNNTIDYLFYIALVLAPLTIVIGAYYLFSSGGELAKVDTGKRLIKWAMIGFGIILLAKAFMGVVESILGIK